MEQLTKEQAIAVAESKVWKRWTPLQIVGFQLYQRKLCMDFSAFHSAIEKVLERPVFTHEFAYPDHLRSEYEGKKDRPSLEEILNLIPKEKLIVVSK